MRRGWWLALVLSACSAMPTEPPLPPDDSGVVDSGEPDAGEPDAGPIDAGTKYEQCATTFGQTLTDSFGRIDGVVTAVVPANYQECTMPNRDHVVVQVQFGGEVYRMVVNVLSVSADPDLRIGRFTRPLPGPAFDAGWHPGLSLDYVTDLDVHTDAGFSVYPFAQANQFVYDAVTVGDPISVYATSSGGVNASGAHLIHRNKPGKDGALVLQPTSTQPVWVLFHFANQSF